MDFNLFVSRSSFPFIAFDPIAFSVGPFDVHWYGIMYLLAFLFFWAGGNWLSRHRTWWGWTPQDVGDMLFYGMLGVVIGGRVGYVLFYGLDSFLQDPWFLFRITQGGMSFHGGLLGVMVGMWWFGRRTGRSFWQVSDFGSGSRPHRQLYRRGIVGALERWAMGDDLRQRRAARRLAVA
jgi:prolipoprotein diacylglyceryl transferase